MAVHHRPLILEALARGELDAEAIAEKIDAHPSTVRSELLSLLATGDVSRRRSRRLGNRFLYRARAGS